MLRAMTVRCFFVLVAACSILYNSFCFSIDNPDAPDIVAEFETRSHKFEKAVNDDAQNTSDVVYAYGKYEQFLDKELNLAYEALTVQLSTDLKQDFQKSQKRWIDFRNEEFRFIERNWKVEQFGTSSVYSRGAYRTTIVKDRVLALLNYTKNYSSTGKKDSKLRK